MSDQNLVTDSNASKVEVNVVNDDIVQAPKEKSNYEVVFFARYHTNPRPSNEAIVNFFSNYGVVDHVNSPEGRNYAFVFMTSLNTTADHRRTRSTISQIIRDMTPENRFHITVASSNRAGSIPNRNTYNQYNNQNNNQNNNPRFSNYGNNDKYNNNTQTRRPYIRNADRHDAYDPNRPVRRPYQSNKFPRTVYPTLAADSNANTTQSRVRRPMSDKMQN